VSEQTPAEAQPDTEAQSVAEPRPHPVRVVVFDDLKRSRLTVFLRLLLVIPHFAWWYIWSGVIAFCVIINWFAALIKGRTPEDLHLLLVRALRYRTHFLSYMSLTSNPYPTFFGRHGAHPVDLELDGPDPQNRLVTFFRLILAIPAIVVAYVLFVVMFFIALLGWFVAIVIGRMPKGMRDLNAYCLRYEAQVAAYLMILTDRYPSFSGPSTS
jgi:hypothetical protein